MKTQSISFALLLALAGTSGLVGNVACAQTADHGKIAYLSRSVKIFSELEQSLNAALHTNDPATQEKLLGADFELRSASNPGVPVARAEWLTANKSSADAAMSQMAVHDHGTLAVVSFLRSTPSGQADQPARLTFVIDVWKQTGNDWQLDTRYESDAGIGGTPEQEIAPDGKG
jgi:hypothetical protein